MNLEQFISEVTSHQKHEEKPRVVNANGSDCMVVEYHGSENLMVIYFNDDVVPVEEAHDLDNTDDEPVLFKGLM